MRAACVYVLFVSIPLLASVPGRVSADTPRPTLTVMTYNIGSGSPTIPLGAAEIADIAQQIKDAGADIVGMEEVDINTAQRDYRDIGAEIADALAAIDYPMDYYVSKVGQPFPDDPGGIHVALWSRLPVVDTSDVDLGFDRHARFVTVQQAEHVFVHFMVVHYQPDGTYQEEHTQRLLGFLGLQDNAYLSSKPPEGPVVVMGDFNMGPDSPQYDEIIAAGLTDVCASYVAGTCYTVGGQSGNVAPPREAQVDFIFGTHHVLLRDPYVPDATVSDHWPLIATVEISPMPAFAVTPSAIEVHARLGANVAEVPLHVANVGDAQMQFTTSARVGPGVPAWLAVSAGQTVAAGSEAVLSVQFDTATLPIGTHDGAIRLSDPSASNSPRQVPVSVIVSPAPGDFDYDSDVDVADFTLFALCFNGADRPPAATCVTDADLDGDSDVDVADFARFSRCFNGPNRAPACPP